jgi:hypothetical protein
MSFEKVIFRWPKPRRKTELCIWCSESHKKRTPTKCKTLDKKLTEACKHVEAWLVMLLLERIGTSALDNIIPLAQAYLNRSSLRAKPR